MAWIKNTGEQPVADDVLVRVRILCDIPNDSAIGAAIGIPAQLFHWPLSDHAGSITEYEVVENP